MGAKSDVEQRDGGYWVAGTRVSLDSLVYAFREGHTAETLAQSFPVLTEEHKEELMVVHRQIETRKARGNPPEITTKLAQSRTKLQEWLKQQHEAKT